MQVPMSDLYPFCSPRSPVTKFAMGDYFFAFDQNIDEIIDIFIWMSAWFWIVGLMGFMLYWILLWGLSNGGTTLQSWGSSFGINVVQDFVLVQPLAILLLNVLALDMARPQLMNVHRVLMRVAIDHIQDKGEVHFDCADVSVRVCQHLSPACRAARMYPAVDLPTGAILR